MGVVRRFVAQQVPVGPGVKPQLIGLFGMFAHRQGHGAVRVRGFDVRDQRGQPLRRPRGVFAPL